MRWLHYLAGNPALVFRALQTGGFASPPYGGFAFHAEGN